MQVSSGYNQYKEQSVSTMTQGEMLIFLYEESIKSLTKAKYLCYNKDYEGFEKEVGRAKDIISYLDQTLDKKYPISADLHKLYDFIIFQLSRAIASRKTEIIDEVIPFLKELLDTWKEADRINTKKPNTQMQG